jgi:hypothetical protein
MTLHRVEVVVVEAFGRVRGVFYNMAEADDFLLSNAMYMGSPDIKVSKSKLLWGDDTVIEETDIGESNE